MSKLWEEGGEKGLNREKAAAVEAFTVGNDYKLDSRLLPFDLQASAVHVEALRETGLLTDTEAGRLTEGLNRIRSLWASGDFPILPEHEDGHTAIELWLTGQYGELGKKIHTGRSRNDQVLTAMRLYERDRLKKARESGLKLVDAILSLAEKHRALPMPGYTHTRKAMLSSAGQWLGGYTELLIMQLQALQGVELLAARSPLGTAAGFGTTIPIDREREAKQLGFRQPMICSASAQLSRGWVELQLVNWLSGVTSVLARLSADVIQFSSEAYRFIELEQVLTTGSSIMPQKKNPDVAELIRGSHSRIVGASATLQAVTANLGAGYHRDLQLTKEPVMVAFETAVQVLDISGLLIAGIRFNEEALREACTSELFAAEEAYRLVREEGLTFRDAYQQIKREGSDGNRVEPDEIFRRYTQLGSPGNPGLERLREEWQELNRPA